jgi:hypothetical protein
VKYCCHQKVYKETRAKDFNLNLNKNQMNAQKTLVFLATILVITTMSAFLASAQDVINTSTAKVRINGLTITGDNFAVLAGETYVIDVEFTSLVNASDVEVSAWIQNRRSDRDDRVFMDLIEGADYFTGRMSGSRLLVKIPENIKPDEQLTLYVRIETDKGNWENGYKLVAQRQTNNLEVLSIDMDNSVKAGETLKINVVVKNMGRHISEDTMVNVKIPALGVSRTLFYEDLSPVRTCTSNNKDCDMDNTNERVFNIVIPDKSAAGVYDVEITVSNDKTSTKVTRTFAVTQQKAEGKFIANPAVKSFSVGEEAAYELILVNTGDNIVIYNLAPQTNEALTITLSESIVVVPAGSSKTVKVYVKANREGTFGFAVDVNADGLSDVARFNASVEGKKLTTSSNNLIAITIVLAIIFVVLLAILVVLLTRKPEKTEEFGESYY